MDAKVKIGIIGDFDETKLSQVRTNMSLEDTEASLALEIEKEWIPSDLITKGGIKEFKSYDGLWAGPGDYSNPPGAWLAIQYAREHDIPFLGT